VAASPHHGLFEAKSSVRLLFEYKGEGISKSKMPLSHQYARNSNSRIYPPNGASKATPTDLPDHICRL
jgi:hypothetical protein